MPGLRDQLAANLVDPHLPGAWLNRDTGLYWVTQPMAALAAAAALDLPAWVPAEAAPTGTGLVLWDGDRTPVVPVHTLPARTNLYGQPMPPPEVPLAGVVWARSGVEIRGVALVRTELLPEQHRDRVARRWPVLAPACTLPLILATRPYQPRTRTAPEMVVQLLGTTWLLMTQPGLGQTRRIPTNSARQHRPEPEPGITIVELRTQPARPDGDRSRAASNYRHRWLVRSHWKMQRWGPGGSLRRPVYISAHIKGPEGAPMLETEKVNIWRR